MRLITKGAEQVSRFLRERAYEPEISGDGVAHLFKHADGRQIDVLVPDGLGESASRQTVPPNRTLIVPGGTQALHRSVRVAVKSRDTSRPPIASTRLSSIGASSLDEGAGL